MACVVDQSGMWHVSLIERCIFFAVFWIGLGDRRG